MSRPTEIIAQYFDAWNTHNGIAVLETFSQEGTYIDSSLETALQGDAIVDYVKALCTLFPDLRLELIGSDESSTGLIAAPWLLFGTDKGGFAGNAPTGKSIVLPGCDFISVSNERIDTVVGLFDVGLLSKTLA